MTGSYKKRRGTQGECHAMTEAEIGKMHLISQETAKMDTRHQQR